MNTYLAGHCLTRGSQMQRTVEKEELSAINPSMKYYNPMDNKEINDKKTANPDGLAERIVQHDTDAIFWSDTVVIEPLPEAIGTHVELGQIKGMRDVAMQVFMILEDSTSAEQAIVEIATAMNKHVERKVYPHYEDIRRQDGITESEDRRSLGINQYAYGVCLDLSGGKGFYSWEEIKNEFENND